MKTKYFLRNAVLAAMMLLPLTLAGCRYDLVEGPSMDMNEEKNAADYKDFILPPASLTATQGESKAVVLTWPAVKNAVQYQVFAAESPFSTFSKVSETTSTETEITIEEEAGITKYYCISAVNYYGTVSSKSVIAMGSTLAVPIITAIDASEEGNSVTVSWWMDNCSSDTYAADVSFNVNVYALSAPNIKFKTLTVDGDTRQVEIDGLTSKTEYYFEVEVVKTDSTSKECSEKTSAETAHRVIPDAPTNVTVSQGETTSEIKITWQLPEGAWYRENSGVSGFVLHPLYFKIYRKLASQSDDKYEVIATAYVEANTSWKYRNNETDSSKPITVPVPAGAETLIPSATTQTLDTPYETYIPGAEVSVTDTTAVRGNKYTYYIQSITDDTPEGKIITADSSKTEAVEGWLVSIPTFSINADYTKSEDLLSFTKIAFSFNVSFETFGQAYTYFIKREKYDLDNQTTLVPEGEYEWTYTSLSDLNEGKDIFEDPASALGYYKYTLYVCPANSTDSSNAYHSIEASGKFLVTNDANAVPVVEEFNLADGYSNKFVLSFTYHSSYTYTIHWKNVVDGISQTEESLELPASIFENATEGTLFEYEHTNGVNSGDRRIYSLEASMGLSERFRPNTDTTDKVYETLGTAAPVITGYDYDKLLVEWPAVQKAKDEYTVSATYADESDELVIADGDDANCEITKVTDGDSIKFTCVITKPAGFDDAEKSGKTIKFKVTAQNQESTDTTDSTIDVCTVGPAKIKTTIDSKYANIIDVKWNPVEGAAGYIISRITYKTATQRPDLIADDNVSNPDVYYYDVEQKTLTVNSEPADSERVSVNIVQDKFKLTDTYKEAQSDTSPYEVNQSYISWGIPFGYTVIPVRKKGSVNDFTIAGRSVSFSGNTYSNVDEEFGSTKGYGLNVHAKKSESADTQVLEWYAPYKPTNNKVTGYYRVAGDSNNNWHKFSVATPIEDSNGKWTTSFITKDKIREQDYELTEAYEYLIAYDQDDKNISVPSSFIKDTIIGLSKEEDSPSYDYTGLTKEKANKGYLLAMDCNPDTGEGYSEITEWDPWDYNARSIGPTSAYICIKNYNISTSWGRVAELNKDLHFDENLNFNKTVGASNNTTLQPGTNNTSIKIEPTVRMGNSSNQIKITEGPLQVLRDAKHYYAIELIRGDTDVIVDNNKYAYRNVDDHEFAKMVMILMNEGLRKIGSLDFEDKDDSDGYGGTVKFHHNGNPGTEYSYEFNNFSSLTMPYGDSVQNLLLSCSGTCNRQEIGIGGYPKTFKNVAVKLKRKESKMPESYERTFEFSLSSYKSGTITSGNTTINIDSEDKRYLYIPFNMYIKTSWFTQNNTGWYDQDPNYGWWPEN